MKPRDDATPRRFMTVAEVAEYLKFRRITIYRWARKGKIPAFKIGTDWRFDRDAIEKMMIDRQVKAEKDRHASALPCRSMCLSVPSASRGSE